MGTPGQLRIKTPEEGPSDGAVSVDAVRLGAFRGQMQNVNRCRERERTVLDDSGAILPGAKAEIETAAHDGSRAAPW